MIIPLHKDQVLMGIKTIEILNTFEGVPTQSICLLPGPNSPIDWVRRCVELLDPEATVRSKILLGLNFYGFDYTADGGAHVLGQTFVQMLKEASDVKFRLECFIFLFSNPRA